jgi:aspartyl-tRNA(Asn)/glutamyl-tRNA(Gln) amidotransferase subunit C
LNEVDTDGVEPMTRRPRHAAPMRDDVVTDGGDPQVLSNSPKRAGDSMSSKVAMMSR